MAKFDKGTVGKVEVHVRELNRGDMLPLFTACRIRFRFSPIFIRLLLPFPESADRSNPTSLPTSEDVLPEACRLLTHWFRLGKEPIKLRNRD